jgi:alpha-galactosidase
MSEPRIVGLRAAGTALLLDTSGPLLPRVLHWGRDVGPLGGPDLAAALSLWSQPVARSSLDEAGPLTLLPGEAQGWSGTPGFAGHRSGGDTVPLWADVTSAAQVAEAADGSALGGRITIGARDPAAGLSLEITLELDRHGVLRHTCAVTNVGATTYDVAALRALMPLPANASEILDLTGRWCRERSPQRQLLGHGTHQRSSRRGRTGHDATLILMAGAPGFGMRSGEVWGVHVAWSGDHEHLAERLPEGAGMHGGLIGGGELLRPGEVRLEPGETYAAPTVLFTWSGEGMDGLSGRIHEHVRDRPSHPRSPRPLVLNIWEAVYFDHDLDRVMALADVAKSVGVERFVIDDGWFLHRRDDSAGLGDWFVDEDVWPDGLHPIVDHVRSLGMQVGLWVEPEMVNLDSDLVRAHPDWLLDVPDPADLTTAAPPWRRQHVLDLAQPEASAYLLERLDALVSEYALDYLKWDHNRDLHMARHRRDGRLVPGVRSQTLATYALLDELRRRHPRLEIESCASGGARVDLGILARTDRVWASDTNDAIERQQIQRWTGSLLPPELVGSHVGPPRSHTTARILDLPFRLATALFGHAGIEWDLTSCTPQELERVRAWSALYRRLRPLLHGGSVVRADVTDDGTVLHGVMAQDGSEAVFCFARLATSPAALPGRLPLPGLDPQTRYLVSECTELSAGPGEVTGRRGDRPPWLTGPPVTVPGSILSGSGLTMPILDPGQALVLHLTAAG